MTAQFPNRSNEVEVIFDRTVELIHSTLTSYYRLTDDEALEARKDLHVWFQRLARRGGAAQMPARALRVSLLSAACQYGRSFLMWKLGGDSSREQALTFVLSREPQEVASDLANRLDDEV